MNAINLHVDIDPQIPESLALLERLMAGAAPVSIKPTSLAIAQEGERYAGIAFVDGKPHHHLFLLGAKPADKLNFRQALAWAESVGGALPERFEAALLYANLQGEFETSDYYWTATQDSVAGAWIQYFDGGYQNSSGKSFTYFARAVHRSEM